MSIKNISILGCGWFGLALAKELIMLDYHVKGSTTTPEKLSTLEEEKIEAFLINFTADQIDADPAFFNSDVLFICIPPKRNSPELADYPDKIAAILKGINQPATQVVLISSTSVYGDENRTVNEFSETMPDTDSGKMVLAAEQILKEKRPDHSTVLRFSGLIGPNRNAGRFFAGKSNIPNGLAPVNLIHQTDAVGIAVKLLQTQAFGHIYNACAPAHPSRTDFYTHAAQEMGLAIPEFIQEKKEWKLVESLNVPKYLDYKFQTDISVT
ncbi:SDR family oxidoreductase [Pedobacter sp. BMA]|uniref:SDR family oxidoreductase n=1 Tax=Pedobacter sp. BMA TaxID=1663685 RepID=UPI000649C167|nr:SDR family oxidoreductase [Pedobacter sp. BMA]KLT66498.1 hypothetical protein AB669_04740 [Pedobacter sp. BMA]